MFFVGNVPVVLFVVVVVVVNLMLFKVSVFVCIRGSLSLFCNNQAARFLLLLLFCTN